MFIMSAKEYFRSMSVAIIIFSLLFQMMAADQMMVVGTDAPTDNNEDEYFPLLSTFQNSTFSSTSFALTREIMVRDGDRLYLGYSDEPSDEVRGILLTISDDNGSSWEEPVRIWPLKQCYGIMVNLEIIDGTLLCVVKEMISLEWEDRSIHVVEVPLNDWRNTTAYNKMRLDDTAKGYVAPFDSVVLGDEVIVFWARSHFIETLYRIRRADGNWSEIMELDPDNHSSSMSITTRMVDGIDTIFYFYLYDNLNRIYLTRSNDGENWTEREEIVYLNDKPARIEVVNYDDKIHLLMSEYDGYDLLYMSSTDGSNWSSPKKIGEMGYNPHTSSYPGKINIAISVSAENQMLYVSHDHKDGVAIYSSGNNGSDFIGPYVFQNTDFAYSTFGPDGNILFMQNGSKLEIRSLTSPDQYDPHEDDNETEPEDPDDNSTEPDDNSTDPEDPIDNSTDPEDPVDNSTDPGDDTDDTETPEPQPQVIEEDDVKIDILTGEDEGTVHLNAALLPGVDTSGTDLEFIWIAEGVGIIGYGRNITTCLDDGEYIITLEIRNGGLLSYSSTFDLTIPPLENGCKKEKDSDLMLILVAIIVGIILAIIPFLIAFRPRSKRFNEHQEEMSEEIASEEVDLGIPIAKGVRCGGLHPVDNAGLINRDLGPGLVPIPPVEIEVGSDISIEGSAEDISSIRNSILMKDLHVDRTHRRKDLLKRSKKALKKGEIDNVSYKSIKELLDKVRD